MCLVLFFAQFLVAQNNESPNKCVEYITSYLDAMEGVLTPKANQVYHLKYTTTVTFHDTNTPVVKTDTEILISDKKVMLDDHNMKIYGNEETMFIVLPEVKKIYWNNSDPKLFAENSAQKKFLDVERSLLKTAVNISCRQQDKLEVISIIPSMAFKKKSGLVKQNIKYDNDLERIISVENLYNNNSVMKRQIVNYTIVNYKSSKKIQKPSEYIFSKASLKPKFKRFNIIDNRK